jgi:hypothetical protein
MHIDAIFNNLGSPYLTCWSDIQETCAAVVLEWKNNVEAMECKQLCNQAKNCNFVFLTSAKHCSMYETCNKNRSTLDAGTTYGKSACPGILSFTIKTLYLIFMSYNMPFTESTQQNKIIT